MALETFCRSLVSPRTGKSFVGYDLVLGIPALVLLLFLIWKLKPCLRKLQRTQSQIMATYYAFLWLVAVLNVARIIVQAAEGISRQHLTWWNSLWLLTSFGLVLLEVSVIAMLAQGRLADGQKALHRTLLVSGAYAFVETLVMGCIIAYAHIQLFFYGDDLEMSWRKWSFWLAHALLFVLIYASMVIIPFTRWKGLLPSSMLLIRYTSFLLIIHILASVGASLLGAGVMGGYCVYGLSNFMYYALYPPLLYFTFLAEFFQNTESDLDMLLYSEMKEAGVFGSEENEF